MIIVGSVILFLILAVVTGLPRLRVGPFALALAGLFGVFVFHSSENYQAGIGAFLVTLVFFW